MNQLTRSYNGVARLDLKPAPTEIDVFRRCAVADRPFFSRYVLNRGAWDYAGPVLPTWETLLLYQKGQRHVLSWRDLGQERCPVCGIIGSPLECNVCGVVVCGGRSTAALFRCRPSCPSSGPVTDRGFTNHGITL